MKVAVIGYGRIGRVHVQAVRAERDVERVVVCDPALATVEAAETEAGMAIHSNVDAMLASVRPDVVHVCTPPATHASIVVRALRSGARVLVEKPMALSTEECGRIGSALRADPGVLCVDHNFLFEPEVLLARRWVAEGRIGRAVSVDAYYGVDTLTGAAGPGAWSSALPGGRFTDLLPHPTYLTMHFLGAVRGVSARWRGEDPLGDPSELSVLLECEHGLGTVHCSLAAVPWELGFTVRGTRGTVRVDLARQQALLMTPASGPRPLAALRLAARTGVQSAVANVRRVTGKLSGRLRGYPGLRGLVSRFYASLRDGLPPPVPFGDGVAVVAVMERARLQLAARRDIGRRDDVLGRRHA